MGTIPKRAPILSLSLLPTPYNKGPTKRTLFSTKLHHFDRIFHALTVKYYDFAR